jgi:glycosyltransferase involved in cell wall biosynthesis
MPRAAILCACVHPGDAVGNDTLLLADVLGGLGYATRVFADTSAPEVGAAPADRLPAYLTSADDLVVYQFSHGWPRGLRLLAALRCRKVVRYHNVTPPHFFLDLEADYALAASEGRRQIGEVVAAGCERYLAASEFNRGELLAAGLDPRAATVAPPLHRIDHLLAAPADESALDAYQDGRTNWLAVGRIAPNKGLALLVEAFARYRRDDPGARLLLAGGTDPRLERHTARLRDLAASLGVADAVVFTGKVSEAALKALYLAADVYVTASEHEGFCIPLVEAMALKVPVVAYGTTAVPETLGGAGLLWDEPDPDLLAASAREVVRDEDLAAALTAAGWARYHARFRNDRTREVLRTALGAAA